MESHNVLSRQRIEISGRLVLIKTPIAADLVKSLPVALKSNFSRLDLSRFSWTFHLLSFFFILYSLRLRQFSVFSIFLPDISSNLIFKHRAPLPHFFFFLQFLKHFDSATALFSTSLHL